MNIREISDVFKDTANQITAIKSYNFGWPSDRTRSSNTEDYQELNEFPRVFFSVPTITGSDQTRKQDTYQVTIFFDDLLGYNNEGEADLTLQLDKWAALQEYANYFVQRLNKVKQTILPNYLFIPEAPSITFDSFTGLQRMITVQLSFTLVVPTNCEPVVSKLVECIANIVTSSNLTAALKNIFELTSTLQASSSLSANLQLTRFASSSLNTASSLAASALVSKLAASSLTGAGTLAADLTVTGSATLLLDLYPNAAAAYSFRKLRTAYTGNAIRVRRSSDNTEQDIGFVSGNLDTVSLLAFCGVGNGFVTTWYDQSGNGNNATQSTAANQPQIVSVGSVVTVLGKPTLQFDGSNDFLLGTSAIDPLFITVVNKPSITSPYKTIFGADTSDPVAVGSIYFIYDSPVRVPVFSRTTLLDTVSGSDFLAKGTTQLTNNTVNLLTGTRDNTNIQISVNGTQVGSDTTLSNLRPVGGTNSGRFTIMAGYYNNSVGDFLNGNLTELILYISNQSSNRTGIETNINTHYAIY
jgi:hypothetical protein